ncbi:uncharacterized protein LOC129306769 [Prosopis cineraria]|uniref:uncharacterized protein LOC129306769 n=1 Tax=Prosopis cineraria TaxID=364024 RepID=UPI00240FDBDC|nr:uncharacterized protein LOC129306769 [Prosopis cineraria]
MERGPRYEAYAELRESKLRLRLITQRQQKELDGQEPDPKLLTPPAKLVRFQSSSGRERNNEGRLNGGRRGCSVLAQSVPDFSAAALRKENRKPANTTPPPPAKSFSRASSLRGSLSANAGERRGGGVLVARKSYAAVDELRSLSSAVSNAITSESRGGRKTAIGCRRS